jgi:hypothetical protein
LNVRTAVSWQLPRQLKANVLGVQGSIGAAFLLFIITTSNPFTRLSPPPFDGRGRVTRKDSIRSLPDQFPEHRPTMISP